MKAAVYGRYGPPDVLEIKEVEKLVPKDNEVLIEVHAASVNPLDSHFMRGEPYMIRLQAGLRRPRDTRLGVDVAGRVEAAGIWLTRFKAGDEVFGTCRGAFAEYACASEAALAAKPDNLTFEAGGGRAHRGPHRLARPSRPRTNSAGPEGPDQRRGGRRGVRSRCRSRSRSART